MVFLINNIYALTNINNRLIVKYKPSIRAINLLNAHQITAEQLNLQLMLPLTHTKLADLENIVGANINEIGQIANGAHILLIDDKSLITNNQQNNTNSTNDNNQNNIIDSNNFILQKIQQDTNVDYAEWDILLTPTIIDENKNFSILNDNKYNNPDYNNNKLNNITSYPVINPSNQWDMGNDGDNAVNMFSLWYSLYNNNPGDSVTIAVIDTGYTPNSNIVNNLTPLSLSGCYSQNGLDSHQCYGYQFISDCRIAGSCPSTQTNNIGIGPQPDALDLGDFTHTAIFVNCTLNDSSSWHGSHVSGIIAASGYNNFSGILGAAYGANILPIRVLGKCGGYLSDAANAIFWAVNRYPGINNSTPAQIISLSLGGYTKCSNTLQNAINTATINGSIVVAAAGNGGVNYSSFTPANCKNVVSVSAKGQNNQLASYSNTGAFIAASGGSDIDGSSIYSTAWGSYSDYRYIDGDSYFYYMGTSQATPHVSASLAVIIGYLTQNNIQYSPNLLMSILQNSANHLSSNSNKDLSNDNTSTLDMQNALNYTINNYSNLAMIANPSVANLNNDTLSTTINFTNESSNAVNITNSIIQNTAGINLYIINNTCINNTINPEQYCSITIKFDPYGTTSATLQLMSGSSIVGELPIYINSTQPSAHNNAGGCASIQNTNDYGLLIIIVLIVVILLLRKINIKANHQLRKV